MANKFKNKGLTKKQFELLNKVQYLLSSIKHNKKISNKNKLDAFEEKLKNEFPYDYMDWGKEKPSLYELKHCYCTTYEYRGLKIDIFDDDYGQCFYFFFNGRHISCGTYCPYEDAVEYTIDSYLDDIFSFKEIDDKYWGAYLKYNNHEHNEILFTYRGEEVGLFYPNEKGEFDIEDIKKQCVEMLEHLFANKEFQEQEKARKEKGNFYIDELIKQTEKESKE